VRVETSLIDAARPVTSCWTTDRTRIGVSNIRFFGDTPNAHTTPPTSPFLDNFRIADNPGINDEKDVYGSFLAGDHTSGRHHIRVA
jgi:hypothetical protein